MVIRHVLKDYDFNAKWESRKQFGLFNRYCFITDNT